jgi:hypothetical protein
MVSPKGYLPPNPAHFGGAYPLGGLTGLPRQLLTGVAPASGQPRQSTGMRCALASPMFHLVARTRRQRPLWTTWEEGCALWRRILHHCPEPLALTLMPDHVHLLHSVDARRRLARAIADYGQWWAHRHQISWRPIEPLPPAEWVPEGKKRRRSVRYVHLNPCRAGLVTDPLAWPLSTHRDAVGLSPHPVVPRRKMPYEFHRYVSSDPSTAVTGTPMPDHRLLDPDLDDLMVAVSALCRVPYDQLRASGPARSLFLHGARALSTATLTRIALYAQVHRSTVARAPRRPDDRTDRLMRVLGDARFPALTQESLLQSHAWRRYRRG